MEVRHTSEKRRCIRHQCQINGNIHFADEFAVSCIIRDFSRSGALIDLGDQNYVAKTFELTIDAFQHRLLCEVARIDRRLLGINFVEEVSGLPEARNDEHMFAAYNHLLSILQTNSGLPEAATLMSQTGQIQATADECFDLPPVYPVLDKPLVEKYRSLLLKETFFDLFSVVPLEASRCISTISCARMAGDYEAVGASAHALKGMAGNFGAVRIASVAKQIEASAREGRVSENLMTSLKGELSEMRNAISRLLDVRSE